MNWDDDNNKDYTDVNVADDSSMTEGYGGEGIDAGEVMGADMSDAGTDEYDANAEDIGKVDPDNEEEIADDNTKDDSRNKKGKRRKKHKALKIVLGITIPLITIAVACVILMRTGVAKNLFKAVGLPSLYNSIESALNKPKIDKNKPPFEMYVIAADETVLACIIRNNTDQYYDTDNSFKLEYYEGDKWVTLEPQCEGQYESDIVQIYEYGETVLVYDMQPYELKEGRYTVSNRFTSAEFEYPFTFVEPGEEENVDRR